MKTGIMIRTESLPASIATVLDLLGVLDVPKMKYEESSQY